MNVVRSVVLAGLLIGPSMLVAAPLYSEGFEADPTANWAVNNGPNPAGQDANFFFDYSTVGIPPAPNTNGMNPGGTTLGLRLRANMPTTAPPIPNPNTGTFSGISVSPVGLNLSSYQNYKLEADVWMNSVGPFPAGGQGSTQVTSFGIMTAGTTPQWAGGVQDSLHFGATAEGGSSVDYRAYSPAAGVGYTPASGVFAAGTSTSPDARNDIHPYYAGIGGVSPPAAQTTLFPATQTGSTGTGAPGMTWRHIIIEKTGNIVTWTLDTKLIATVNITGINFGGGNILLGQYDINGTTTGEAGIPLLFGLFDNVYVTPEPSTVILLAAGLLGLCPRRRGVA